MASVQVLELISIPLLKSLFGWNSSIPAGNASISQFGDFYTRQGPDRGGDSLLSGLPASWQVNFLTFSPVRANHRAKISQTQPHP